MLELGVTPSHVSVAVEDKGGEGDEGEREEDEQEEEEEEENSYCIPLESLGLGGNQITDLGAGSLADGLKTNRSKWKISVSLTLQQLLLYRTPSH